MEYIIGEMCWLCEHAGRRNYRFKSISKSSDMCIPCINKSLGYDAFYPNGMETYNQPERLSEKTPQGDAIV